MPHNDSYSLAIRDKSGHGEGGNLAVSGGSLEKRRGHLQVILSSPSCAKD